MRGLLLPVKELHNAKQRLANILSRQERVELASAMLADTVRAVAAARFAEAIFLVSSYEPAVAIAVNHGWEVLREESQVSESASVDWASRLCSERGVTSLLRLPLDLPLLESADLDELLQTQCEAPAVVLVPSRDGTGTNAILRTPPTLFPSHFGPESFAKHRHEAEKTGATVILKRNPRIEMDVDDESDLRALLLRDLAHTETGQWLERTGIAARFRPRTTAV